MLRQRKKKCPEKEMPMREIGALEEERKIPTDRLHPKGLAGSENDMQRERRRRAARLDVGSKRKLERRMADGRRRRRRVDEQRGAVCIERKWRRSWFERSAGLQLRIDVLRK